MSKSALAHNLKNSSSPDTARYLVGDSYPFLSSAHLTAAYRQRAEELSQDINNILPPWARNQADQIFKKKKFIVCGTCCLPEIKMLARNADILAIVDDRQVGGRILNIPIIDTDSWIKLAKRHDNIVSCLLVPSCSGFQHFIQQCIQWEIPYLDPFHYLHLLKLNNIDMTGVAGRLTLYGYDFSTFAIQNHEKLIKLSKNLSDEFSKISWFCILLYRITWNPFYLTACCVGYNGDKFGYNSYAINRQFYRFSDREVYADCGTFNGDTVEYFLRAVNGKFKHIYAYDPSADNHREIRARLNRLQNNYLDSFAGKISLFQKGVWDSEDVLLFNSCTKDVFDIDASLASTGYIPSTSAAHIVGSGMFDHIYGQEIEQRISIRVPVTTIDLSTNQDATFIKLEVEGSEGRALKGAQKTIERNQPKISLSIYHKPDDFVVLFEHMLNLQHGYKYAFRQHNPMLPDSMVLYCYR